MFWQLVVSGLATGCVYALVALGLTLIYRATEHVNFAQGELAMVGAFLGYTLHVQLLLPVWAAVLGGAVLGGAVGWACELAVIRPAEGQPHVNVFIITLGLSIVLKSLAGMVWSHDEFPFPPLFSPRGVRLGSVVVTPLNVGTIAVALGIMVGLFAFFRYTRHGVAMRAVCENPEAAQLMGVEVRRVYAFAWILSAGLSALAGALIAPVLNLSTHMGAVVIPAFAAAILGGWGSFPGAIAGGMALGVIENLAGGYLAAQIKNMVPFLVVLAVLVARPQGLLGEREVRKV